MNRLIIFILFLVSLTGVNTALCQWNFSEAPPQRYTATEDYVIAVGEELAPEVEIGYGFSGSIPDELDAGEISNHTRNAFESKGVRLSDRLSVSTLRKGKKWLLTDNQDEKFVLAYRFHRYDTIRIYRPAVVKLNDFYRAIHSNREIRLWMAIVEGGPLNWQIRNRNYEKDVYIIDSIIVHGTLIRNIKFNGEFMFSGTYLDNVVLHKVEFEKAFSFHNASVERSLRTYNSKFSAMDFSEIEVAGGMLFKDKVAFGEKADFKKARISSLKFENVEEVSAKTDFSDAIFEGAVNFGGTAFQKEVKFSRAEFEGRANFKGVHFEKADFFGAAFRGSSDFSGAIFNKKSDFAFVSFCDKNKDIPCDTVDFTTAVFFSEARFSFAKFLNPDTTVKFQGAQFKQRADFSYTEMNTIDFSSYTPLNKELFKVKAEPNRQQLDNEQLPEDLRKRINKYISISEKSSVEVLEREKTWLINDKANHMLLTVIREQIKEDDEFKDVLIFHLRFKGSRINQFNLIGTNYRSMKINSSDIKQFLFDDSAFRRFLKNQKELGRDPIEFENALLSFKRYQRGQKWFLTRWLETILLDWTTQYGTARIPWGLVIYAMFCVISFAGLYRINPDFLMFVNSDGRVDEGRKPPGWLEIFWFSSNTFIPAIEFFNATNWRPKYDVMFPGGFIRYGTIATIERILGWAMVPSLLSYF